MANVFWMKDGKILGSNGHPSYGDSAGGCCCNLSCLATFSQAYGCLTVNSELPPGVDCGDTNCTTGIVQNGFLIGFGCEQIGYSGCYITFDLSISVQCNADTGNWDIIISASFYSAGYTALCPGKVACTAYWYTEFSVPGNTFQDVDDFANGSLQNIDVPIREDSGSCVPAGVEGFNDINVSFQFFKP